MRSSKRSCPRSSGRRASAARCRHRHARVEEGLVGHRWALGKRRRVNQLTLINARLVAALAHGRERWTLAGDQLYVDFDLSSAHVPPGTHIRIGAAEIEVSPEPHTGCRKFAQRFIGSERGRALSLRGINAWVVKGAEVRVGTR
jgi:hypothetical protein